MEKVKDDRKAAALAKAITLIPAGFVKKTPPPGYFSAAEFGDLQGCSETGARRILMQLIREGKLERVTCCNLQGGGRAVYYGFKEEGQGHVASKDGGSSGGKRSRK